MNIFGYRLALKLFQKWDLRRNFEKLVLWMNCHYFAFPKTIGSLSQNLRPGRTSRGRFDGGLLIYADYAHSDTPLKMMIRK
jgi:hypothetical protein